MKMDSKKAEVLFSWIAIIWLIGYILVSFIRLDFWWAILGIVALAIVSSSMVTKLSVYEVLPVELIVILIAPLYVHASSDNFGFSEDINLWNSILSLTSVMSFSVIGMFLIAQLQAFTDMRMNRTFAILFVTIFSLAASCIWSMFEYVSDIVIGTELLKDNYTLMTRFVMSTIGGLLMGLFFALYLRLMPDNRLHRFGLDSLAGRDAA